MIKEVKELERSLTPVYNKLEVKYPESGDCFKEIFLDGIRLKNVTDIKITRYPFDEERASIVSIEFMAEYSEEHNVKRT